jgi:hypothetical protein
MSKLFDLILRARIAIEDRAVQIRFAWQEAVWHHAGARGNGRVHQMYQAVADVDDSLTSIEDAIRDGDHAEALQLLNHSRESIKAHVETLRGLL